MTSIVSGSWMSSVPAKVTSTMVLLQMPRKTSQAEAPASERAWKLSVAHDHPDHPPVTALRRPPLVVGYGGTGSGVVILPRREK